MSFGLLHISPRIPAFLKRYPKTSVDLVLDDTSVDLVANGFDLSIRTGDLPDSTLIARKLTLLKSVICIAPEYVKQTALTLPADLANENCMLYSYSSNANDWTFTINGNTEHVTVKMSYKVSSSEALKRQYFKVEELVVYRHLLWENTYVMGGCCNFSTNMKCPLSLCMLFIQKESMYQLKPVHFWIFLLSILVKIFRTGIMNCLMSNVDPVTHFV